MKKYSGEYLDLFDQSFNKAAAVAKERLSSQQWVPESWRPKPPSKPKTIKAQVVPMGLYTRVNRWVLDHKMLTGTFVLGMTATTVGLIYRNRRHYSKKRRAKRASNNARLEVVLLAGSPSEPLVKSLALDLERRGFIVFIVCNDVEEEVIVQNEGRPDIRPLTLDITRVYSHHSVVMSELTLNSPTTLSTVSRGICRHHSMPSTVLNRTISSSQL